MGAQGLFQKKQQEKQKEGEGEGKKEKQKERRLVEKGEENKKHVTDAEIKKKENVAIERTLAGLYLSGVIESKNGKAPTPAPPAAETLPQVYAKTMAGNPDKAEDGDAFEVQLVAETLVLLKNGKTAKNHKREDVLELEPVLPIRRSESSFDSPTQTRILLIGEAMLTGG